MASLLLASNTFQHGYAGPLDHCLDAAAALFAGCQRVLCVPWAMADHAARHRQFVPVFDRLGIQLDLARAGMGLGDIDGVFVPGGNTFRLVRAVQEAGWIRPLQEAVHGGLPYMGTSAGSNLACPTLCTTNDMPIVQPAGFGALGLVPFQINAHYLDPDPSSTHRGETREQRIREYHEENDRVVVGLREGSWVRLQGGRATLEGLTGARIFRRGRAPEERAVGADLSDLLG